MVLALNRLGAIDDDDLRDAFCAITGLHPSRLVIDPELLANADAQSVSLKFLEANRAVLLAVSDACVEVGAVDPLNPRLVPGLRFALQRDVKLCVIRARDERRARSDRLAESEEWGSAVDEEDSTSMRQALEFDRDAPVARRVSKWLGEAVEMRASDVHIEPRSNQLEVRYRVDGVLNTMAREPIESATAVIARIKVLADLDLGERRVDQDGRATIVVGGRKVDIRVSVVPSVHGEAAVLRILDRGEVRLDFEALGFSKPQRDLLDDAINWPHGLFLVTGPTGSGKTTTLYAALERMRGQGKKILTVEDPVEFHFDHVTQVQVAAKAGVGFASSIRSFLRQDPDVIFVGEIRDAETAKAAVQAALTGHLVLASVHTIDATKALPRLLDMGVEPFQLSACFRGVLAQRLVRRLCPECRAARPASAHEAQLTGGAAGERIWIAGEGCPSCDANGYRGRLTIAESFRSDERIAAAIRDGEGYEALARDALGLNLVDDGLAKVRLGLTTLDEVERAMSS
ncbi:GspE/PulE family protein [Maricaulis sp.]|uniref:GspE/PulE family protein n=1 Tax=Maricaulis sp. TaxID=1486257 RepID=UPI00261DF385|nr:GspE/PulE family protein [Maricaulis sp.]